MLSPRRPTSLSNILAIRMITVSISVSLLLAAIFFVRYISDTPHLREATLRANTLAIANALVAGQDPAQLPLYRDHPDVYGFRVFDRRLLATRHILAAANTRWLPAVQRLTSADTGTLGRKALATVGTDLLEGFERLIPPNADFHGHALSLLIHRVVLGKHKYWIQAYMIGDPAWAGLPIIIGKLVSHVLFPVLFLVPALTLAMFLTVRGALGPLRRLAQEASQIGGAVARGQALAPVSEHGMAQEFADVAGAINAMLEKLERSLLLQKQFASDAAHELRTPLAVLLLEASRLPAGASRERIKADLKDLSALVNELLRFAQAEDAMWQELSDVDVAAVARNVCEEAAVEAIGRRQELELDCAIEPMLARGSATLIEIAIRNIVENALKYSPPGSTVNIRVEPGPVVIVEDDGPGISPDQRDRVFDRFWRTNASLASGTGVGLALVRRIAQLHSGDVFLESGATGGTRVVLILAPLERARHRVLSATA